MKQPHQQEANYKQQIAEFKQAVGLIKKQSKLELSLMSCVWNKSAQLNQYDYPKECIECKPENHKECNYFRPYMEV